MTFFINFFIIVFICIKKYKNLSAKYYKDNKERPQKSPMKDIKIFLKLKKKRNNNTMVKDIKV